MACPGLLMVEGLWLTSHCSGLAVIFLELSGCSSIAWVNYMSRFVGKPTIWFPNRSDTNRPVQSQKMARGWKF